MSEAVASLFLIKYNPYHDERGRFATAEGAGFVSTNSERARAHVARDREAGRRIGDKYAPKEKETPKSKYQDMSKPLSQIIDLKTAPIAEISKAFQERHGMTIESDSRFAGIGKQFDPDGSGKTPKNFRANLEVFSKTMDELPVDVQNAIRERKVVLLPQDIGQKGAMGKATLNGVIVKGQDISSRMMFANNQLHDYGVGKNEDWAQTESSRNLSQPRADDPFYQTSVDPMIGEMLKGANKENYKEKIEMARQAKIKGVFLHELGHTLTTKKFESDYEQFRYNEKDKVTVIPSRYGAFSTSESIAEGFTIKHFYSKEQIKQYFPKFNFSGLDGITK
jgi:hypothetical protein